MSACKTSSWASLFLCTDYSKLCNISQGWLLKIYVACWSVCDRDEEGYILSMPWSLDRLSKKALITWFNFDPGRKCFYTGHVSDYRAFSCDVITFEITKRKTAAMLVYNEIGAPSYGDLHERSTLTILLIYVESDKYHCYVSWNIHINAYLWGF